MLRQRISPIRLNKIPGCSEADRGLTIMKKIFLLLSCGAYGRETQKAYLLAMESETVSE